ncbi:type II toxin-antitoxin system PemK/MazF family toxin, partial [Bacteroides fragilis]
MVEQYEVYWVELDPTRGGEMAKTRPCVVVTPSDLNMYLTTVVIVP